MIVAGDLNRKVGTVVPNNHDKVTAAGSLLLDLVNTGKYVIVNSLECVTGGPFTRYDVTDPDNEDKKSLLDYVIVSSNLVKYVEKLEIDKNLLWTLSKTMKGKIKYPDHYALQLSFKNLAIAKVEK